MEPIEYVAYMMAFLKERYPNINRLESLYKLKEKNKWIIDEQDNFYIEDFDHHKEIWDVVNNMIYFEELVLENDQFIKKCRTHTHIPMN